MNVLLFVISAVSLTLAVVMTWSAVRMARAERARTAARVAALSAAAAEPELPRVAPAPIQPAAPIRVPARAATAPEPAAPWTAARVNIPKPILAGGAPVAAASPSPAAVSPAPPARAIAAEELPLHTTAVNASFLDRTPDTPSGGRQRGLAIAAVLLFAAVVTGGYATVFGNRATARQTAASGLEQPPLELVSLRHERRGARLDVTGLVRNPSGGLDVDKLTAVVFLFDRQGGFLASGRAGIDYTNLTPGDESPFVVSLDAPASVARYRVSFRTDAGVVPHIDRRGQEPLAANAVNTAR
jgi:hypothetical protein